MAKRPKTHGNGTRRALEAALDAVERLGRATARRTPEPDPETEKSTTKARARRGEGGERPTRAIVAFPPKFAAIPRV